MNKSIKMSKSTKPKALHPAAKLALKQQEELRIQEEKRKQEEDKIREEEERRAAEKKAIEDEKQRKKELKQEKINKKREEGTLKTKSQKLKEKLLEEKRLRTINTTSIINVQEEEEKVVINKSTNFRSPITCIMGHVDTGKTKIMDNIRNTNVQEGEVGGITQQIGATFIPKTNIIRKINKDINIPGLLMIDTPGHESFSNLRERGSTFADIVILVIDIVHGLENQTIESINILKDTNTKFIIALNKIDRLYGWQSFANLPINEAIEQNESCIHEFQDKLSAVKWQLQEQGINSELYWINNDEDNILICPVSAITSDGMSDLLNLVVDFSETKLIDQITINDELKCVVLEKTALDNYGITVDVLLISGTLKKGDDILIKTSTSTELVKTQIRNLFTPPPNCESRVTKKYNKNESLTGSIGFKLIATNLEDIIVGSDIICDSEENLHYSSKIQISSEIQYNFKNSNNNGIIINASSEGSLEALIDHLKKEIPSISIIGAYIGKVSKKHVDEMIVLNKINYKEINTILAFDVNVDDDAIELANKNNITILKDETIYRLATQYTNFRMCSINARKEEHRHKIVYPCILEILKDKIFRNTNPFVFGVKVIEGSLHVNTPLIIIKSGQKLYLGNVTSIQVNNRDISIANTNAEVCIKIELSDNNQKKYTYGRHFTHSDLLLSKVTRESVDIMKLHFKDEITNNENQLNDTGLLLKKLLNI